MEPIPVKMEMCKVEMVEIKNALPITLSDKVVQMVWGMILDLGGEGACDTYKYSVCLVVSVELHLV